MLMLIFTLLTKRSSGQRWKLYVSCIILVQFPPPSFSGCYSFRPSFLPFSAYHLSLTLAFVYYVYVVYVR